MSMYNLIHGHNPLTPVLLAILSADVSKIPRYRDIWWDGEHIVIHTRTGGGNRDYYDEPCDENRDGPWNSDLRAMPGYVSDEDDDYDSTYADFKFKLPEKFEHMRLILDEHKERPAAERWQEAIGKLRDGPADDPDVKRIMEAMAPTMKQLSDAVSSGESGKIIEV